MSPPATRRPVAVAVALLLAALVGAVPLVVGAPVQAAPGVSRSSGSPGTEAKPVAARVHKVVDPLRVEIERLTPSTMPKHGRITVTGRIVNQSDAPWSKLSVYLLTSRLPITSATELTEAQQSDPRTEFGERIITPGLYENVPDLAPGQSTPFRLSVRRDDLDITGEPGVYWLGVHVLGSDPDGRLDGADGRARTFLPLVPDGTEATRLALAMQFRNHVVRAPTGELQYLPKWQHTLTPGGRLGRLLRLSRDARAFPLSWVVDPAVVQAAVSVSRGNPANTLTADPGATAAETASGSNDQDQAETGDLPEEAVDAARWLRRFDRDARDHNVLAVPFADLDVSAAVSAGTQDLLTRALASSTQVLEERGISSRPFLAPLTGFLSPDALAGLDHELPVALTTAAVPSMATEGKTVADRTTGGRLLVVPPREALFGATPGQETTALSVRQTLLARAALHALSPTASEPMAVLLPPRWDPGPRWRRAAFFQSLDVPWIQPTSMGGVLDGEPADALIDPAGGVEYTDQEAADELPPYVMLTAQRVFSDSVTLRELLTDPSSVGDQLDQTAMLGTSTWSRNFPGVAAARLRGLSALVRSWFDEVAIRGPSFVTMSSEEGAFPITIVNGLDQPVTVGLRTSVTGGALKLVTPEPIALPAGGRHALRIEATSSDIGIHQVTVQPVTSSGKLVGTGATLSVRSSKVGLIVWVIMGIGAGFLFLAIAVRLVRRVARGLRARGAR